MPKPITYVAALTLIFLLWWSGGAWAPNFKGGKIELPHPVENKDTKSVPSGKTKPDEQARQRLRKRLEVPLAMSFYDAEFAVHLFNIGFDEHTARDFATAVCFICSKANYLIPLWKEEHRLNPSTIDTVESILALNEKAEQIREQDRIDENKRHIEYGADLYEKAYEKAKALPPEIIDALRSAKLGRKILLSPYIPKALLRASDNPAHDRAIIEHVWYVNAMALHFQVTPESLHLIDLFRGSVRSEAAGDAAETRVQGLLSDIRREKDQHLTADQVEAIQTLRAVLVGEIAFDQAFLVGRLKALEGHSIFILGHIPEAPAAKGVFEHKKEDGTMTHTPIAKLAAAFRQARVSFAPVGCLSEMHHPIGVDRSFLNVSVLKRMESVLASPSLEPASMTQWFSDFIPPDARLILDPLSLESTDPIPVIVEIENHVVSHSYIGAYIPPPPPSDLLSGISNPSVPILIAEKFLPIPLDSSICEKNELIKLIEKSGEKRFGHPATYFLVLGWIMLLIYISNPAVTWFVRLKELWDSVWTLGILFLPVIISRLAWGNCFYGCELEPGYALPTWCGLYGFVALAAEHPVRKKHWLRYSGSAAILVAALLFGLANSRIAVAPEILAFCDAFAGL